MTQHKVLALFDFDGTLTHKDSLGDFIQFAVGKRRAFLGGMILAPTLIRYVLGSTDNSLAKQHVLCHFFAGESEKKIRLLGRDYATHRIPAILRPEGLKRLAWHQEHGHEVVIVSASVELWLKDWTDSLGIALLATYMEVQDGYLTGRFAGQNCHSEEKVRRIRAAYSLENYDEIYAYGDTSGDRPMLALAHQQFYKPFR